MSITITITIDAGEVSAHTTSPQSATTVSSPAIAAAGLIDAGEAPNETSISGMLSSPRSDSEQNVSTKIQETSAGAAPSGIPGLPQSDFEQSISTEATQETAKTQETSAGAAPSGIELSGIVGLPNETSEGAVAIDEPGDTAAGAAPSAPIHNGGNS